MKFYVTIEPIRKLKNVIANLCSYYIINIDELRKAYDFDMTKNSHKYLFNTEVERLISSGVRSKRYSGIIYINSQLECDTISSIKNSLSSITNSTVDEIAVIDDFDAPKLKEYYKLFDEVLFFQPLKRGKIIECVPKSFTKERKDGNVFKKDI